MKKIFLFIFLLTACAAEPAQPTPTLLTIPIFIPLPTATETQTPLPTPMPESTATAFPAPILEYEQYSIDYLRTRSYGGGTLDVAEQLSVHEKYTTYSVRYLSDELYIYAVMNVPNGDAVYPVVISVHGYFTPEEYYILDTDFAIENKLAEEGYITIHPTMRNYPPSDSGDNLFRVGDTIDILNLIAIVKSQSGFGILEKADSDRIGLYGRSMGGGISLRVLTITKDVKAAFLYSPTSGDESRNTEFFHSYAPEDGQFNGEINAPTNVLEKISPQNYFSNITTPILLAHGTNDRIIPATWSEDTCNLLKEMGLQKRCIFYKAAGHTFYANDLEDLLVETLMFFTLYLRQ